MTVVCACGKELSPEEFYWDSDGRFRAKACQECDRAKGRVRHEQRMVQRLLEKARRSAQERALEFRLTEADLGELPERCPVFGCLLRYETLAMDGTTHPCTPVIHRLNEMLGYVPGNVVVVSARAEKLRQDATFEEIEALYRWASAVLPKPQRTDV